MTQERKTSPAIRINIDPKMRSAFKSKTAAEGKTMQAKTIELIAEYLTKK